MSNSTKKNMSKIAVWNAGSEKRFNYLKEALTQAPILVIPNWILPFILQTDVFVHGLGYVLSQVDASGEE